MSTVPLVDAPATAPPAGQRRGFRLALLATALVFTCGLSLALGAREIPWSVVWDAVVNLPHLLAHVDELTGDQLTIAALRVPRTLLALVVGACLGVAGALIQGHTRNPLADPGLLGISSGAGLAVTAGFFFFRLSGTLSTALLAFAGAAAATALVFGLASIGAGQTNPLNLVLGGAAVSAVLNAVTTGLVLLNEGTLDHVRFWTVGSVAGGDLGVFWVLAPLAVVALLAALAHAPVLNLLNLGDDVAAGLGVNVPRARVSGMLLIALLAGLATAAAGPVGFLALVVPHLARALTGPDYRWVIPASALAGALLLLVADITGRIIARPSEVQVGIVLALVGAPAFLLMLRRNRIVKL